jgi:hypothetical protein
VEKGLASGHVCGPDHAAEHIRFVTGTPSSRVSFSAASCLRISVPTSTP